jgi:hypothetical protein
MEINVVFQDKIMTFLLLYYGVVVDDGDICVHVCMSTMYEFLCAHITLFSCLNAYWFAHVYEEPR